MARPHVCFPRAIAIALCGATLTAGALAGSPAASAQSPRSTVKSQIAAAQRQLQALNNQAEIASERYNAARIKLAGAQKAAQSAQTRLSTAQSTLTRMQASVTALVVAAYQGNNATSVMTSFASGTTEQQLSRMSSLQAISVSESQTLAGLAAARRAEQQAQADSAAALAAQRTATASLAANRRQIEAAAARENTILSHLQAKERRIIQRAKRRAARRAARQAAARLAAQRAAAAAAAQQLATQASTPPSVPQPVAHVAASGGAATAVQWAYREIGKPYVWGAAGPNSFDCSGLAQYVWAKAGVYLEHFTGDQWNEGTHIARADVEPGDLVFFATNTSDPGTIHHVGIYVGGGMMIDAPYTGVDVRKEPAFRSDYIGAVRPG
jgi:cell wall-associated NlpC family hydrolase